MPMRRWMRHTESSMPTLSSASRQASTCWYTLSTSVPSRSNRKAGPDGIGGGWGMQSGRLTPGGAPGSARGCLLQQHIMRPRLARGEVLEVHVELRVEREPLRAHVHETHPVRHLAVQVRKQRV